MYLRETNYHRVPGASAGGDSVRKGQLGKSMKTILVVDDEVHVRRVVSTRLEKSGYRVIMAESAEIALALAARIHVDLVITDNSMSGMSGIEMAKLLRTYPQHADVPVLMISSHQFEIGK